MLFSSSPTGRCFQNQKNQFSLMETEVLIKLNYSVNIFGIPSPMYWKITMSLGYKRPKYLYYRFQAFWTSTLIVFGIQCTIFWTFASKFFGQRPPNKLDFIVQFVWTPFLKNMDASVHLK